MDYTEAMASPEDTIAERWRLYRRARENGTSEVEAYDYYVHPRTRVSDEELDQVTAEAPAD